MYKFNGFTDKATKILNTAILSAQELGHTYIGSEHIVLGMLREKSCIAYNTLKELGITEKAYYTELIQNLCLGNKSTLNISDFTPRAKKILETSLKKIDNKISYLVGTDCILLAVMKESTSLAVLILNKLGLDFYKTELRLKNFSYLEYSDFNDSRTKTSKLLENFGTNLNDKASDGKIDPLIGRDKETKRLIQILSRRNKNNPCLVGDPGVGKTAIVEGLALKIIRNDVPTFLSDKKIISLNLTYMVAGTRYRGDFEERVKNVLSEVKKDPSIILFIDELHSIIGAGSAEGSPDIANILKPSLTNGEIQIIGATTLPEYRKYISKDSALERRFSPIEVDEPSQKESINIIMGIKNKYEDFHDIKISNEAIECSVKLSNRYITDRFLPDKAIDLIDEASSNVKLEYNKSKSLQLKSLTENINSINKRKHELFESMNMQDLLCLKAEEKNNLNQLEKFDYYSDFPINVTLKKEKTANNRPEVKAYHIADIVSLWTGIPLSEITKEEGLKLLEIEEKLNKNIIGQTHAVKSIANALKRGRTGIKDRNRPLGSFIFLGPTGVGKTKLCKSLSEIMFGKEDFLIRFDMSEFMEKHSISRLIGSPPGYIGYDNGGQLTEKVKKKPYSILLFDEIEKAHHDVINILLQILEDGHLTDSQGRKIDFKNTIIIMTSNIGARIISNSDNSIGFGDSSIQEEKKRKNVLNELKKSFSPELLNRIDETVIFNRLNDNDIFEIAKLLFNDLSKRLEENHIYVDFSEKLIRHITQKSVNSIYGARPLRRIIQDTVENKLADKILLSEISKGDKILCDYDKDLTIQKKASLATI